MFDLFSKDWIAGCFNDFVFTGRTSVFDSGEIPFVREPDEKNFARHSQKRRCGALLMSLR